LVDHTNVILFPEMSLLSFTFNNYFSLLLFNEVLLPEGWTRLEVERVNISEAAIDEDVTSDRFRSFYR